MNDISIYSEPLQRKIRYSIELLQKAEKLALTYDKEDGFYLAFSGGKDSQCLYHIAQLAGVKFKAHMNLTSVDPPEVIRFVKRNYPEVRLIKPKKSIYDVAKEKHLMPTRKIRWCCKVYKENAGAGKVTLIGIRHAESLNRSKRNEVEISGRKFSGTLEELDEYRDKIKAKRERKLKRMKKVERLSIVTATEESTSGCISGKDTLIVSPIIHRTDKDVWEFLNKGEYEHCSLYDKGYKRIGCILCPMQSNKRMKQKEMFDYPHVKRNWIKTIQYLIDSGYINRNFSDSEIGFNWWISGKSFKKFYSDEVLQQKIKFK